MRCSSELFLWTRCTSRSPCVFDMSLFMLRRLFSGMDSSQRPNVSSLDFFAGEKKRSVFRTPRPFRPSTACLVFVSRVGSWRGVPDVEFWFLPVGSFTRTRSDFYSPHPSATPARAAAPVHDRATAPLGVPSLRCEPRAPAQAAPPPHRCRQTRTGAPGPCRAGRPFPSRTDPVLSLEAARAAAPAAKPRRKGRSSSACAPRMAGVAR